MHFTAAKKIEKTFRFCDLRYSYFKDPALTVVKGDAKFLTKYMKGVPFVSRKYVKGVPFLIEGI